MSQQINLLNPALRRQRKAFSAATMAQALGIIAAGMVVVWAYAAYKVKTQATLAAQSEKQLAVTQAQFAAAAKVLGPQGEDKQLFDEMRKLEDQAKARRDLVASLSTGALGNAHGFSRYLTALARQKVDGVWLTGVSVGGDENDLVVRGRVLRPELVPMYLNALNQEDVMRGRSVTELSLSAVQAPKPAVAPGQAGESSVAAKGPQRPLQFVEFNLVAPRRPDASDPRRRAPS